MIRDRQQYNVPSPFLSVWIIQSGTNGQEAIPSSPVVIRVVLNGQWVSDKMLDKISEEAVIIYIRQIKR